MIADVRTPVNGVSLIDDLLNESMGQCLSVMLSTGAVYYGVLLAFDATAIALVMRNNRTIIVSRTGVLTASEGVPA